MFSEDRLILVNWHRRFDAMMKVTRTQKRSMSDMKDPYETLGVTPKATDEEIKRAYRKLARKTHPDLAPGPDAEAAFKEVNAAYDILKDPEARAEYDEAQRGGRPGPDASRNWDGGFSFRQSDPGADDPFGDTFSSFFSRASGPFGRSSQMGGAIHARVALEVEDAFHGSSRTLSVPIRSVDGDGRVRVSNRDLSVRIPAGITEGQILQVAGQGDDMGDVFLEITFAPHPIYRVEGHDIFMDLPITPWEGALGAKIVLPTPGGKVDLKIPANAKSGQKLRLKGKGIPAQPPGNLYATLQIVNPKADDAKARALFEKMAKEMPFDPRETLRSKVR